MFNFFKKNTSSQDLEQDSSFDIELVAYALAYEVAIADGAIDNDELARIKLGLENISIKLSQSTEELFQVIEGHTKNSVSFYEFVEDINSNFNKEQKLALIKLLWETAYADNVLEVNEERLIRRVADLIRIKSSLVLKLKEEVRTN
ncbi:MAG: TerB family tellurite resistance protein [SAR86 cluster bacterium]|uniref:TerB family tellurite resistance protein n=1 Tax=SAR86 cluster bacterium TaxID=2030880 RepID=A0A937M348_9GAMM|nr:TerB family tellurite resistance protein [SAR86 cluster bacterium]